MTEPTTAAGPFRLVRDVDATGISGTGPVAQGFIFDDGTVALRWLSEHRSTAIYPSIEEVEAIHGHNGSTRIEAEAATLDVERLAWSVWEYDIDSLQPQWKRGGEAEKWSVGLRDFIAAEYARLTEADR